MTTNSQPAAIRGNSARIAALICRLIRLRTVARLLTFWLIEMPTRVGTSEGAIAASLD